MKILHFSMPMVNCRLIHSRVQRLTCATHSLGHWSAFKGNSPRGAGNRKIIWRSRRGFIEVAMTLRGLSVGVDGLDIGRLCFQDGKKERLALRWSARAGGPCGMGKQIAGWWIGYRNISDLKGLFHVRWQKYRPRSSTVNTI